MSGDHVEVATSGTVARHDRCWACQHPMLYRVDGEGHVTESFCGNPDCHMFVVEIEE